MLRSELDVAFAGLLGGRRLLAHPFYLRWEAGDLRAGELAGYAGQYRHFEQALPEILEEIVGNLDHPRARELVQAGLDDELGVPAPHLEMFDEFAAAVGGRIDDEPSAATETLVHLYRQLAAANPVAGLGAVAAYEVQASQIAVSKAQGLRNRYGLGDEAIRFWDVHGVMDEAHSGWTLDALALVATSEAHLRPPALGALEAWWSFLDDREKAGAQLIAV